MCKSERGTCISAYWVPDDGTNSINACTRRPHVGIINFFIKSKIQLLRTIAPVYVTHTLAYVQWFKPHAQRDMLGEPMEEWQKSYLPIGMYSFIPVARIRHAIAF